MSKSKMETVRYPIHVGVAKTCMDYDMIVVKFTTVSEETETFGNERGIFGKVSHSPARKSGVVDDYYIIVDVKDNQSDLRFAFEAQEAGMTVYVGDATWAEMLKVYYASIVNS